MRERAIEVRVDGHDRCVAAKRLRRLAGKPRTAATRLSALVRDAKLLPHGRRRHRAAIARMRGPRAQLLRRVTAPRALTSSPTVTGDRIELPAGQLSNGIAMEGSDVRSVGGHQLRTTVRFGGEQFGQRCPGVAGELPGRVAFKIGFAQELPLERQLKLEVRAAAGRGGALTGHVSSDARLRDYDLVTEIGMTASLRVLGPAGLVHGAPVHVALKGRVVLVGLKPGMSADAAIAPDHVGSTRVSITGEDVDAATAAKLERVALMLAASFAKSSSDTHLREGEKEYFDRAACLKAVFDPNGVGRVEPRTHHEVGITVRATSDDREQPVDLLVSATNAHAGADQVHAPGRLAVTAGDKDEGWT